jgi:hypothetical protein
MIAEAGYWLIDWRFLPHFLLAFYRLLLKINLLSEIALKHSIEAADLFKYSYCRDRVQL